MTLVLVGQVKNTKIVVVLMNKKWKTFPLFLLEKGNKKNGNFRFFNFFLTIRLKHN